MLSACLLAGMASASHALDSGLTAPSTDAACSQTALDSRPTLEIYGFVEADAIVDLKRNDPDWYDVNRPTRLPAFADEFGQNGHFYLSPRQSRFGVNGTLPSPTGDVTANFELDMLGVGPDAGLTTIRLRHAWGQWNRIGAGQTFSQFMDPDVYPNRFEAWGPIAMPTTRNVQVFWRLYRDGESNLTIAAEKPGAAADAGDFTDRIELQHIKGRFPMPDITGHYRQVGSWGHVQIAGIVRRIAWDDLLPNDPFDLNGHVWGWGVNLSSNIKAGANNLLRLQGVYGRGIENYINDAPVDVAVQLNPGNRVTPVSGKALPVRGVVAYLEHNWTKAWSTTAGYSWVDVSNSDGQAPSAFRAGQYATANLVFSVVNTVLMGGELQWAQRRNFSDGWTANDYRCDFSFKYIFSVKPEH